MNQMTAKELKQIAELRKELGSLEDKLSSLPEKKAKLEADQFAALASDYKQRIKEAKEELIALKKKAAQTLSSSKKQIDSLEREEASLNNMISKMGSMPQKGVDKNEIGASLKGKRERLKAIARELATLHEQESAISLCIRDTAPPAMPKAMKKTAAVPAFLQSPVFYGVSLGVLLLAAATVLMLNLKSGKPIDSEEVSAGTNQQSETQSVDSAIEEVDLSGVVNGNNVNMREEPNVSAPAIKQLQKGEKVTIFAKTNSAETGDAVFSKQAQITTEEGKQIKLDSGKGIFIIEERENSYLVRYEIEDDKMITGTVDKDAVQRITGEIWYKVTNEDGITGWMYGKYVDVQ